ncbi:SseB family protein [Yoonia sp. 208BN28-4]|uniref:SseB family protein n=1 Tax=Yoonia sp. 208BN28-4 TaxID=3126505 RepID=UPI0030AF0E8E
MTDTVTDLDTAHAAMNAAPDDDAARLRFYERLADTELFLLLAGEPEGDQITPELFDIEDQQFVLVFDREERLSEFVGRTVPYAGLPGRGLAQMLAGQGIGLALNLQVAPSAMLIPGEGVDWLVDTLAHGPEQGEARIMEFTPPTGLPEAVVTGLDRKLAIAAGLAKLAYLAGAEHENGMKGHVLAFVDAVDGAEQSLANAASEALTFSGIEAGAMDVLFLKASDPAAALLAKVGLRFDLPVPEKPQAPGAPGMDPDKPPKLR